MLLRALIVVTLAACASSSARPVEPPRNEAAPETTPAVPPRHVDRDAVMITIKQLAFEAYPQWAASHPNDDCPPNLDALIEYLASGTSPIDPWGGDYEVLCGSTLPAGVKGLGVRSLGADGRAGTSDDLRSWE